MENTNILIIEDNNDINEMIYNYLNKNGFKCYQAYSGTEGLLYCKNDNYDLIILDLMLPGMDGKSVLVKIREKSDIPVIVLTAKDSLNSKVEILEIGADDYLCKPFELEELLARIHVQLRKSNKKTNNMTFKKLTLDNQIYDAIINNQPLQLTRHEYYILELLIKNPKRVFTKQEILEKKLVNKLMKTILKQCGELDLRWLNNNSAFSLYFLYNYFVLFKTLTFIIKM